jgi:hypothetical protein
LPNASPQPNRLIAFPARLGLLPVSAGVDNTGMQTLTAHFDGKALVPDAPLDLAVGETVEVSIRRREEAGKGALELLARLPLIRIAPEDAEAINRDPSFDVEES